MIKLTVAAALCTFALTGCSSSDDREKLTEKDKADFEQCIALLKERVESLEAKGYQHVVMDLKRLETIKASREYHLTKDAYDASIDQYHRSLASKRRERLAWKGDSEFTGCPHAQIAAAVEKDVTALSSYHINKPIVPIDSAAVRKHESELDRINREVDEAQQSVLEDYRRLAVSHSYTTGSGFRIDQFVMNSGKIVHCKTTISSYGNAVDCN